MKKMPNMEGFKAVVDSFYSELSQTREGLT